MGWGWFPYRGWSTVAAVGMSRNTLKQPICRWLYIIYICSECVCVCPTQWIWGWFFWFVRTCFSFREIGRSHSCQAALFGGDGSQVMWTRCFRLRGICAWHVAIGSWSSAPISSMDHCRRKSGAGAAIADRKQRNRYVNVRKCENVVKHGKTNGKTYSVWGLTVWSWWSWRHSKSIW